MFVSNMKILTLNSKQNVTLVTPIPIQQHLVQTGETYGNGGSIGVANTPTSKGFDNESNGGESTQKTLTDKGRGEQHQKQSVSTNKAKYNHNNNGNKTQQPQHHQKYHHSSNNNNNNNKNKNKKQHYNNNNSSSSSLNRKKFYQQQQNALQQKKTHHHNQPTQPQQYLPTSPHTHTSKPQHTQPTKEAPQPTHMIDNITTASDNNNSVSVQNQNYTKSTSETNVISTISDECTCGALETSGCDKLSTSSETPSYRLPHYSTESNLHLKLSANTTTTIATSHNNISALKGISSDSSDSSAAFQFGDPDSCACWSNISSFPPHTRSGHFKVNTSNKLSASANKTNLQDFVAATFAHKCSCHMHSTVPAVTSNTLTSSTSKKETIWKNSYTGGGDSINSCSVSPKLSNDQNADITADLSPHRGSAALANVCTTSVVSSSMVSPAWQEQTPNSTLTITEAPNKQNVVGEGSKVETSCATEKINIDSTPSKDVGGESTHVSERGPLSPNAYTLDFLHSVGVQLAGGTNHVSLDAPLESGNNNNNVRVSAGTTPPQHGNRTAGNSTQRAAHSYMSMTNPRQSRNMSGSGNGNNNHHHHHHHYPHQQQHHHHHPSQLTIASFLQKDLLGKSNAGQLTNGGGGGGGRSGSAMGASSSYSEKRGNTQQQQQHYTRHHQQHARYHSNFLQTPHYQQQQTYGGGYASGVSGSSVGEFSRTASNVCSQRPIYGSFTNYHSESSGSNNLLQDHHRINQEQNQYSQQHQSNKSESQQNFTGKKASHISSSASSCSSSSSSSNSSYGSHQKHHQQQTGQRQKETSSTLNSVIETVPSKFAHQHLGQRLGHHHHRGGHYHGHNCHSHHNHQGHHYHALPNTPTTPQHQNYYNLTYVSTDGNVANSNSGINSTTPRVCSPAPQPSAPAPAVASSHSPHGPENASGPAAAVLYSIPQNLNQVNYSRYSNAQNSTPPQFPQYQPQKYLNKKLLVPLTLAVSSPSPSTSPTLLATQHMPMRPHNIICCSQLDEATTAAAAAAAKTEIIAGNEYASDTAATTHSTAVLAGGQIEKFQSLKSLPTTFQQGGHSTSGAPVDIGASATRLYSPLDYAYAPTLAAHTFPVTSVASTAAQNTHQQQQMLNSEQFAYNSVPNAATGAALPQVYQNSGVISLLNLPSPSSNSSGASSTNILDDDYHQRQQPHHIYVTHHQSSNDNLNMVSALSLATNSNTSNSSSGYWSPSHQCNFLYHQLSSGSPALMTSNTPSDGTSASSSVSPCLTEQGDDLRHEHHQQHPTSGVSSPSCLNGQLVGNHFTSNIGDCSSANSSSSNSSVSGQAGSSGFGTSAVSNSKCGGSTQLLVPQQQRSIAQKQEQQQQQQQASSTILNCSSSALSNSFRLRNGAGRNQQHQEPMPSSNAAGSSGGGTINATQQTLPGHIFSQHQSLSPLPLTHNLLYNNPQTHHLRAISNASMHDCFSHTPPDRFLARAHLIEAKETPTYLLNSSKWDNLSQGIWKKFVCSQQTEQTFKQKMRLWRFLYLFIKNAYPRYGLYLVGSTISGFGSDTSDVDMCLVSRSASSIEPRTEALFNLTILRDCLSKSGEFEHFNLIEAKVPILRFRDRVHQLEVDLNFNNCVGIKNTHLLYCYSQLDWRLRPLVLVTKLWAQHHNINNAKNMTISSYSLVLMVIHFLQYAVNPPVLPCLHDMFPDKFPLLRSNDFGYVDMNETLGPYESKNNVTIGELFLNFLEYYSCFDYTQFAISVRTGGTLPINVCRAAKSIKNDPHQWKELCIEEPFDLTNTARSVYDFETFERVKAVFVSSWHVLQETLDLNAVFLPFTEMPPPNSFSAVVKETSVTHLEDTNDKKAQQASLKSYISAAGSDVAEEIPVLKSSIKQTTKGRDTKIVQAPPPLQCPTEHLCEEIISTVSAITTTANSTVVLSSSFNANKRVSGSETISTAKIS